MSHDIRYCFVLQKITHIEQFLKLFRSHAASEIEFSPYFSSSLSPLRDDFGLCFKKVPPLQAAMEKREMPVAIVAPNLKHIWPHLRWLPEMTANLLGINACITYCITAHLLFFNQTT